MTHYESDSKRTNRTEPSIPLCSSLPSRQTERYQQSQSFVPAPSVYSKVQRSTIPKIQFTGLQPHDGVGSTTQVLLATKKLLSPSPATSQTKERRTSLRWVEEAIEPHLGKQVTDRLQATGLQYMISMWV